MYFFYFMLILVGVLCRILYCLVCCVNYSNLERGKALSITRNLFPFPLGAKERLRYFLVAFPESSIYVIWIKIHEFFVSD